MRPKPTVDQVRAYRETHECGIYEARDVLLAQWKNDCLYDLRLQAGELYTVEGCQTVIVDLLDLLRETT